MKLSLLNKGDFMRHFLSALPNPVIFAGS